MYKHDIINFPGRFSEYFFLLIVVQQMATDRRNGGREVKKYKK